MTRLDVWLREHPLAVDGAWAFAVFCLAALSRLDGHGAWQGGLRAEDAVALVLCGLMVVRRRRPDAVVAGALVLGLAQACLDMHPDGEGIAYLVFAYTGAAFGSVWISRLALVGCLLTGLLAFGLITRHPAPDHAVLWAVLLSSPFLLCWAWGRLIRTRRAYLISLEERAVRLEQERDANARVAVADERARIARELHDVVAHNVSLMAVQAGGAACVVETSPALAREALGTIASTGRKTLAEMRSLLGVLRAAGTAEEYVPQPRVEDLPELLEQVRTAGLPVEFSVSGESRELPRGVELAVYRIVQEALANVRKHGGPDPTARVTVDFGDRRLGVLIEDDGRGGTGRSPAWGAGGTGHGLIGMRERVAMVGGRLEVGPRPGGGFRVRVVLPLAATGLPRADW
ncbi:sensor histidine kinase [Kitasatospora sp. NPDC088351]|uniref:sensor histidine kinase n=1 Tax=Kitasatospora sp. NPDC088351 TaxID=3155180 RepID=UPI003439434A